MTGIELSPTNGLVFVTADTDLPSTVHEMIDLPGTTITINVETPQILIAFLSSDISVEPGVQATVVLDVDGTYESGSILGSGEWIRSNVSQTYRIPLSPGTHTIKLRATRLGGSGFARVWANHTRYTYLLVSQ